MVYRRTERVEARLADNRDRILKAARQLVTDNGFREAQIASIASLAGVAVGTVYRYFPTKADLFAEIVRTVSQREVDVLRQIADSGGRRPNGLPRPFAPSRVVPSADADWPGPSSPSRSMRKSTTSAWSIAAITTARSNASSARGSRPETSRRKTSRRAQRAWSARSWKGSWARSP